MQRMPCELAIDESTKSTIYALGFAGSFHPSNYEPGGREFDNSATAFPQAPPGNPELNKRA
jgi:hypothetical protein